MVDTNSNIFYILKDSSIDYDVVMSCGLNGTALLSGRLDRPVSPIPTTDIKNQSWSFVSVLDEPNTYYLRNDSDIYLKKNTIGNGVLGCDAASSSKWELVDVSICIPPSDCTIKCKIKEKGASGSYLQRNSNSIVLGGSSETAVIWDVQVQSEWPIIIE